ncbi:MAG: hypothetical protein AAFX87_05815 [Bacteroidota bacterium]
MYEHEKNEVYRAIGELAYVVAKVKDGLKLEEKKTFFDIVEKELEFDAWAAESRFELLDEVIHPTVDHAYNEAIHELKKYKVHFTDDLKEKAVKVLEAVSTSCSTISSEMQNFVIDRFKQDLEHL